MNDQTNTATITATITATPTAEQTQEELRKRYGCNSYSDFLHKSYLGQSACTARLECRLCDPYTGEEHLQQIHGSTERLEEMEVLLWWIIERPEFAMEHTHEPIFYDDELQVYAWPQTFGNSLKEICPKLYVDAPQGVYRDPENPDADDDLDDLDD